jgi:hypothetical protein
MRTLLSLLLLTLSIVGCGEKATKQSEVVELTKKEIKTEIEQETSRASEIVINKIYKAKLDQNNKELIVGRDESGEPMFVPLKIETLDNINLTRDRSGKYPDSYRGLVATNTITKCNSSPNIAFTYHIKDERMKDLSDAFDLNSSTVDFRNPNYHWYDNFTTVSDGDAFEPFLEKYIGEQFKDKFTIYSMGNLLEPNPCFEMWYQITGYEKDELGTKSVSIEYIIKAFNK